MISPRVRPLRFAFRFQLPTKPQGANRPSSTDGPTLANRERSRGTKSYKYRTAVQDARVDAERRTPTFSPVRSADIPGTALSVLNQPNLPLSPSSGVSAKLHALPIRCPSA